jgi:hypothetical protein
MDEPPELQYNGHWRMAVWALRVGYVGLAVAIAGLIVMSLGSTPWVLAVGVFIWLVAEAVTLAGYFWSRHELPEPRPGYWSMRFMLIHDTTVLTAPPFAAPSAVGSLPSCRPDRDVGAPARRSPHDPAAGGVSRPSGRAIRQRPYEHRGAPAAEAARADSRAGDKGWHREG